MTSGAVFLAGSPDRVQPKVADMTMPLATQPIVVALITGPGPPGPMIFDEAGNLVWFDQLPKNIPASADLQVQQLYGKPVLTWWQGPVLAGEGFGDFCHRLGRAALLSVLAQSAQKAS